MHLLFDNICLYQGSRFHKSLFADAMRVRGLLRYLYAFSVACVRLVLMSTYSYVSLLLPVVHFYQDKLTTRRRHVVHFSRVAVVSLKAIRSFVNTICYLHYSL